MAVTLPRLQKWEINMLAVQKGFRGKLDNYVDVSREIAVEISVVGPGGYDHMCLGVDANGKAADDRYTLSSCRTLSPSGEIVLTLRNADVTYGIQLSRLPSSIDKLVFVIALNGIGSMANISRCTVKVTQNNSNGLTFEMLGSEFHGEKAIIALEFYRKNNWRIAAVGNGFCGGINELLQPFGCGQLPLPTQSSQSSQPQRSSVKSLILYVCLGIAISIGVIIVLFLFGAVVPVVLLFVVASAGLIISIPNLVRARFVDLCHFRETIIQGIHSASWKSVLESPYALPFFWLLLPLHPLFLITKNYPTFSLITKFAIWGLVIVLNRYPLDSTLP